MPAFDEKHLGIRNRIGRMEKLAADIRRGYAASGSSGVKPVDAVALADLVEIFFRDDLNKLLETD